jgi:hypothetical protein
MSPWGRETEMAKAFKKDYKAKPMSSPSSNSRRAPPKSLVEFFRQSPLAGLELDDLKRDRDAGRDIDLEN